MGRNRCLECQRVYQRWWRAKRRAEKGAAGYAPVGDRPPPGNVVLDVDMGQVGAAAELLEDPDGHEADHQDG